MSRGSENTPTEESFDELKGFLEYMHDNLDNKDNYKHFDTGKVLERGIELSKVSRALLTAAENEDSSRYYKAGESAFDDLVQKISFLIPKYSDEQYKKNTLERLHSKTKKYRDKVGKKFNVESITEREYQKITVDSEIYQEIKQSTSS